MRVRRVRPNRQFENDFISRDSARVTLGYGKPDNFGRQIDGDAFVRPVAYGDEFVKPPAGAG